MKKANIVCALVGMIFSAGVFIATLGFRQFRNVPVGPEFFPRWLSAGLFICCLALLVVSLGTKSDQAAPSISPFDKGIQRLLIGLAIAIAYAACWEPVGFIVITPVAVFALMFLLGKREYRSMLLMAAGSTAVIFCAFRFLLGIDMPMGLFSLFGI
ncbi:MAG: tripartite tricarboxylate transporter TctB family protein [Candidatus Accumulibacter sp.]|jgi:putative tricarboxylic transport membrane protein|nr:tripartite tricarboxylate transporter TctB family protein [Accumulibacter sp.]